MIRGIVRKQELNGPFLEVKSQQWVVIKNEDSDEEIEQVPE
jgi:hypothetical protein